MPVNKATNECANEDCAYCHILSDLPEYECSKPRPCPLGHTVNLCPDCGALMEDTRHDCAFYPLLYCPACHLTMTHQEHDERAQQTYLSERIEWQRFTETLRERSWDARD